MRTRPPLAALPALVMTALVLTGCGEKEEPLGASEPRPFELMLDYFPNADHAGIYAAQAKDRFRSVGLDVSIRQPPDPAAPIKQVAAGRVDLGISYEPEVLRARDEGLDVVAVASIVRVPLTSIISLPEAGIASPEDLEGKTVGTAGIDYQSAYLQTILARAGIDPEKVEERNVGFNLSPALLTGKVDAVLGAFWNYEGTELELRGRNPRIIRMEDAGVPPYNELVLVANRASLEGKGDEIRRFIGALAGGTKDLERNPKEAIRGLLDANKELDRKLQRAVVKKTLPFFLPPKGKPFGWQDPDEWEAFASWARENGLIKRLPRPGEAYSNEFLPGEGL